MYKFLNIIFYFRLIAKLIFDRIKLKYVKNLLLYSLQFLWNTRLLSTFFDYMLALLLLIDHIKMSNLIFWFNCD